MLVLSRRKGEQIWIGDGIRLTVVSIEGGRVRLGLQAPPDVPILREELASPQRPAKQAAAGPSGQPVH